MSEVAVIIPAYKAEATLEATVKSLLAQTLRDIEIWIVDDGSPDTTGEKADRLAELDERVHVIHQKNGGCYRARLAGMRQVKTRYFGFVDADDTVQPDMYERMLAEARRTDADVVQCRSLGSMMPRLKFMATRDEVLREWIRPVLVEGNGAAYVWDKLYRNKGGFGEWLDGNFGSCEDLIHNMQLFRDVERMAYIDEELYRYCPNDGSVTRNFDRSMLASWSETIKAKRALLPLYGVGSDDVVMDRWITKNAINLLKKAVKAHAPSFAGRVGNVMSVICFKEFRKSFIRASGLL
jgi:heptose III glucuronosyltransferase